MSDKLFIHETTARYRMNKIYEIFGVNNKTDFHAKASIAVMADNILTNEGLREF